MAHLTKFRNSSSFSRLYRPAMAGRPESPVCANSCRRWERMLPAPVATNHSLAPLAGGWQRMSTLWRSNMATFTVNVIDYPIQTGHFLLILMAELDELDDPIVNVGLSENYGGLTLIF